MKYEMITLNDGRKVVGDAITGAKKFTNKTQAQAMVDKLTAAGFKAFVSHKGGPVFYAAFEDDGRRYIVDEQPELGQVDIWDVEHIHCPAYDEEEVHDGLASAQATAAWSLNVTAGREDQIDKVEITQQPEGSWTAQDARNRVLQARQGCLASFKVSREYLLALRDELRSFTASIEEAAAKLS